MLYERTLLPGTNLEIPTLVDRGCITDSFDTRCAYNNTWIGDQKADCCYHRDYCNAKDIVERLHGRFSSSSM